MYFETKLSFTTRQCSCKIMASTWRGLVLGFYKAGFSKLSGGGAFWVSSLSQCSGKVLATYPLILAG